MAFYNAPCTMYNVIISIIYEWDMTIGFFVYFIYILLIHFPTFNNGYHPLSELYLGKNFIIVIFWQL